MPIRIIELMRSRVLWPGLAIPAVYFVVSFFVPARLLIEIGDSFAIPMSLAAMVIYGRDLLRDTKGRKTDHIDIVMLGICGAWAINAFDRLLRLHARLFEGAALPDSHWIGLFLFMLTYFAALHVYAKGVGQSLSGTPYRRPVRGTHIIAVSLIVGTVAALATVWVHWSRWGFV